MKLRLSKNEKLTLLIGTLIVVLLIVIAQFLLLKPLKSNLEVKEQSLKTEQQLLETITQKRMDDTAKVVEDTRELQKRVPVTPLQEQVILDLERAENVSNSNIRSIGFSVGADVATASAETPQEGTAETQEGTTETQETASQDAANQQPAAPAVSGVKKITMSLSVESPSYEHLEKFISTLESLNRIVVVENISYSGGQEVTSLSQGTENEKLNYSLSVSAYYLPTLEDLLADLPKIDAPAPANKKNPLSTFADGN
ncbi:GspMb/PilO family protein [Neobacillus niacini]|uniref:GspMb/PilO family protein n=1 Tax=Neobacillus niacini TaxID=86668 RepID=UPI002041B553|nr:GspMb/PilO family protein [Neobacillus niacini]MCM3692253.1 GspMb/PilO family protein [Neobacillus niacini]